jgi:hypothetical protein
MMALVAADLPAVYLEKIDVLVAGVFLIGENTAINWYKRAFVYFWFCDGNTTHSPVISHDFILSLLPLIFFI